MLRSPHCMRSGMYLFDASLLCARSALGGAVDFQYGFLLEHWLSQVLEFFQVVLPGVEQLGLLVLIYLIEEKNARAERILQESVFQAVRSVSG